MHMSKLRPGRAPPLSRGRWCAPGRRLSSGRHLPLSCGQSLRPRWNNPSTGGTFTRRHRRFTAFTHHPGATGSRPEAGRPSSLPPVFSSPAAPGWNNGRFGFYLGLRTPQSPATHAKAETGHRALARVLRHRLQPGLQRRLPLELMHPHFARSPRWTPASRSRCPSLRSCRPSARIVPIRAFTVHTVLRRAPGRDGRGVRVHTIPESFATSTAATRSRIRSCSSSSITCGLLTASS